jgi:tetratricopeptide (TPR) repeat protein
MTSRLGIVLVVVAACQPWYRDAERAGRDGLPGDTRASELADQASAAAAHGDHANAAQLYRQAIDLDPDSSAYLPLAKEELALGDGVGASATARRGLEVHTGDHDLAAFLAARDAADDRIANALDDLGAETLYGIADLPELAPSLGGLQKAGVAEHPSDAVIALAAWMSAYGVPDHKLLRFARDEVASKIWSAAPTDPALAGLARAPDLADREAAAGHAARALALYGEVYRLLPSAVLEQHMAGFLRAAHDAGDVFAIDASAYRAAMDGDEHARRGELGAAVHAYRRAVALAPWWVDARHNLATLLTAIGRADDAREQERWVGLLTGQTAPSPAPAPAPQPPEAQPPEPKPPEPQPQPSVPEPQPQPQVQVPNP